MTDEVLYVGCYTPEMGGSGEGVTALGLDRRTGALTPLGVVAPCPSPSFLTRHPRLSVLYAAHELPTGAVSAWSVRPDDPGAPLVPLGERATGGAQPCHLAIHPGEGHLVATNYGGGSIAVHPLDDTGAVGERTELRAHEGCGPDAERQDGPHPHMARFTGDEVLVVDLGCDAVYPYRLDERTGRLEDAGDPLRCAPGTGPRHLALSASGRGYLVGELSGEVLLVDPPLVVTGQVPTSTRPGERWPSEVALGPGERFLYVANRGPDTISVFDLSGPLPRLLAEVPTGGQWPRHFAISGDLLFVANERSHTVVAFRLDPETGVPLATGHVAEVPSPTYVLAP